MRELEEPTIANPTMIYRAEQPDSPITQVSEIWGARQETRTVDADEVDSFLEVGWSRVPISHEGGKPVPKVEKVQSDADAMKRAADELEKAQADVKAAEDLLAATTAELEAARAENAELKAKFAAFDRDGDGKPGGSRKKEG